MWHSATSFEILNTNICFTANRLPLGTLTASPISMELVLNFSALQLIFGTCSLGEQCGIICSLGHCLRSQSKTCTNGIFLGLSFVVISQLLVLVSTVSFVGKNQQLVNSCKYFRKLRNSAQVGFHQEDNCRLATNRAIVWSNFQHR
jgi:hypothetical protein